MSEFQRILGVAARLATEHPGHVFIGGVAVYLHAINNPRTKDAAEASHDADLMLALADFADLRDTDEVVANRRLSKHQLIRDGVEFDVYVERQNKLTVPYDEVAAHAVAYGVMRVACLEHLLVLKLEAFRDRMRSAKGDKQTPDFVWFARLFGSSVCFFFFRFCFKGLYVFFIKVGGGRVLIYLNPGNGREGRALFGFFFLFLPGGGEEKRKGTTKRGGV